MGSMYLVCNSRWLSCLLINFADSAIFYVPAKISQPDFVIDERGMKSPESILNSLICLISATTVEVHYICIEQDITSSICMINSSYSKCFSAIL
jgi:hypothetical protein